jgi:hypothetical protein
MLTVGMYLLIAEYLEWAQQTVRETIERWQQGGERWTVGSWWTR